MSAQHADYCARCHRLVGFHIHNGAMCCDRCGHQAPATNGRDAIGTIKKVHAQSKSMDGNTKG